MLRVLIGTGLLLMTVGFGASGWQYWKSLPSSQNMAAEEGQLAPAETGPDQSALPPPHLHWLISATGGLVPPEDASAYLVQDRFVPTRTVQVLREASLASLLAEGEKLPDAPFLQVLADIRSPRVAEGLCERMAASIAEECAVNSARVVDGSVDPVAGTAMFQVELVYRLKPPEADLPDLATHVLRRASVPVELEAGSAGATSPDAALGAILDAITAACAAEEVGDGCRPMSLDLDWRPGQTVRAKAEIAWLDPLPEGMVVAPPLDTVPGG